MKIAVFPGSFDPFTLGHYDIVKSSMKLFDKVIIGVGHNYEKRGYFSVEERVAIIERSVEGIVGVEVIGFTGLTVEFCKRVEASFIIRGLRSTTDFELERVIAQANLKMAPEITTLFIPSGPLYGYISSSVVRDILINGGSVEQFMVAGVDLPKK
ncbi:MAG: pantetheine-phosphate adenylyltransferase [Bacteroidales bacterium]